MIYKVICPICGHIQFVTVGDKEYIGRCDACPYVFYRYCISGLIYVDKISTNKMTNKEHAFLILYRWFCAFVILGIVLFIMGLITRNIEWFHGCIFVGIAIGINVLLSAAEKMDAHADDDDEYILKEKWYWKR